MPVIANESKRLTDLLKITENQLWDAGYMTAYVSAQEAAATDYEIGMLLGTTLTSGAAVATADAGNTGNGTVDSLTVDGSADTGTYTIEIVKAVAAGGEYVFKNSDGAVLGYGVVGNAFSEAGVSFIVSGGAVDWAVGDTVSLAVSGTVQYKISDPAATDGSDDIAAVVIENKSLEAATATPVKVLVRGNAIVADQALVLGNHTLTAAKAALEAFNPPVLVGNQL